jgi:hypothetical protein
MGEVMRAVPVIPAWARWQPSVNLSEPYANPQGLTLQQYVFCGFCDHYAKPVPQTVILPALLIKLNPETQAELPGRAHQSRLPGGALYR